MARRNRDETDRLMNANRFDSLLRSIRDAALPVGSVDQDDVQELIIKSNLIWGYDERENVMPLFYGKELLADIARGRDAEFGYQMLLCFSIDLTTDDPETLAAAVKSLKGSCCYSGSHRGKPE
jgi:hypothetical protein